MRSSQQSTSRPPIDLSRRLRRRPAPLRQAILGEVARELAAGS
jgi:hypothetical protein